MRKVSTRLSVYASALVGLSACSMAGTEADMAAAALACDRACLISLTDDYVAGLAKHDAAGLPFADDFAFVENVERMEVGEGLWSSATSGATQFSLHVPDEASQIAGWMGVMARDGKPVIVTINLKLEDGKIATAEHRIANLSDRNLANLETPRAGLVTDVPAENRLGHDELIRIGGTYYDAVDDNDGTKMPFATDCQRQENGMITAGEGAGSGSSSRDIPPIASDCAGQLSSGIMTYITTIEDRRVFAADPQTGLAMGFSIIRHPMDFPPHDVTSLDGTKTTFTVDRFDYDPFDNVAAHIWKIGADGEVHEIEAMGFLMESEVRNGWDEDETAPAEPVQK